MKRRKAREYLLQILYQADMTGRPPGERELALFWENHPSDPQVRKFTEELLQGVLQHLDEIDSHVKGSATHWEIDRISPVDRNILRFGVYELLYRDDIPGAVTLNEAIEIAKKFSTSESHSFINGILDEIRRKVGKRLR